MITTLMRLKLSTSLQNLLSEVVRQTISEHKFQSGEEETEAVIACTKEACEAIIADTKAGLDNLIANEVEARKNLNALPQSPETKEPPDHERN